MAKHEATIEYSLGFSFRLISNVDQMLLIFDEGQTDERQKKPLRRSEIMIIRIAFWSLSDY